MELPNNIHSPPQAVYPMKPAALTNQERFVLSMRSESVVYPWIRGSKRESFEAPLGSRCRRLRHDDGSGDLLCPFTRFRGFTFTYGGSGQDDLGLERADDDTTARGASGGVGARS